MPLARFAYLPLITYPEPVSDDAIEAAIEVAEALGCDVHATTLFGRHTERFNTDWRTINQHSGDGPDCGRKQPEPLWAPA